MCDARWARSAARSPVLTCNVTLKGIREKTDSRVVHARSHRAAPLPARYTAMISECSCYITMFCYKSVAGLRRNEESSNLILKNLHLVGISTSYALYIRFNRGTNYKMSK
jgi:hypothetical protein